MAMTITKDNFEQEVIHSDTAVLLDFYADWCMPCKMLSPVIEEIASEVKDTKVCKVNIDEESDLAALFRVMSIPTLVLMKDGKVVDSVMGVQPKAKIMELLSASRKR